MQVDHRDAVGITKWQRAIEDAVDGAEDCGVHSDRERQRHASSDRERGRLQQNAQTETNIGEEIMPATNKPDSTRNFFVLASGPEFESRLPEGRFTGESRLFQVRGTL